jgi:predicted nucleotidyltransferase
MSSSLADLLFKDYRRRVLGLLLLRPDQAYHVREIARLTGTVPGTLHKELSRLAEVGILTKQEQGNQVTYRANRDCIIFEELASILRKTYGVADVLAEALAMLAERIDVALVFGSMASGKATAGSDIDLLVVGDVGFAELVKELHTTQETLGREINPKLYSRAEWRQAREQRTAFVRELLERPVINVIGDRDDLG